jgi:hypothetical protein
MGALICNYFLDEASREHTFLIDKMVTFSLSPSGITSDLTLTVAS